MRGLLFLMSFISLSMVAMQAPQPEQDSKKFLTKSQWDLESHRSKLEELKKSLLNPKTPALETYFSITTLLLPDRALIPKEYYEYFTEYELVEVEQLAKAQCTLTHEIIKAYHVASNLPDEPDAVQISDLAKAQTKLCLVETFCKKMR